MRTPAFVLALVMACGHGKATESEMTGSVRADISSLKTLLAQKAPGDRHELEHWRNRFEGRCSNMVYLDKITDPAVAAEYKKLCTHDVPITILRMGVEIAEATKPAADSDCYAASIGIARDELERNHTADAESQALEARLKAVCTK
jgi:hypothetical protein